MAPKSPIRSNSSLALSALVATAIAGCHAGNGAPPASPAGGFTVSERAETGPITAIAVKPPYLWAAGPAGLRRFDVTSGDWETVGENNDTRTRAITAIAIDDDGAAWTAGAMGIARWVPAGDDLRYEPKGTPGTIHALVARRPVATEGIWAGGPGGLFHYNGRIFPSVDGIREVPVSTIVADDDGKSAWVGTHKHGLYHAEGEHAAPVPGGEAIFLDSVLGVAKTASGTRMAAGNAGNEARLYALTLSGVEGFHAPPGPVVVALVDRGGDAVLLAGPPGKPQAYTLRPVAPNEPYPPGSLKFASLVRERAARWAAVPTADKLAPDVTVAASAGNDLFVGSARMGVARATPDGPRYLAGSQLVGDAQRLYLACAARTRCYAVTEGPRAWLTDGATYQTTRLGEPEAATPLALVTDAQGTIYAVAREAESPGLVITRLAPGVRAPVETDWQPLHKIALELPAKSAPTVSFAAVSGANTMWLGLRVTGADGADSGFGAVEIELGNGHAVQHRPYGANEHAAPESLPLPSSLTGILFDSGATYYASLAGVSRWQEGQLRTWSENDGLASEMVHAIARGSDGAIWAATSEGVARFDGQNWLPLGTTALATRGLAKDGAGRIWVATGKGLRVLPADAAGGTDPGVAPVIVEGDMRDVAADRFGRIWGMSTSAIALVEAK
ncbi:MAG TPA: hypothetical protein VN903_19575 [Polyangia bacterium]|jgi:hypothetical protein|nr:hypothetical protein [Polyangia bacterium]